MEAITVLSTACAAMFMPGVFDCLKNNGEREIRVIGVDIVDRPFVSGLIDCYYKVPPYTDKKYVETLLEICKREHVTILFPNISMELQIIQKRVKDFEAIGVKVALTDSSILQIANNKLKLYKFMREQGLSTPKFFQIFNSEDLRSKARMLGFPDKNVVVKIAESSGSRGVRIISGQRSRSQSFLYSKPSSLEISMEEMCQTIDECLNLPDTILMEYLPGCEYTVDLLADNGKTIYIAGRRNTESQFSIAMASEIEKNPVAYDLCRRITAFLSLDGNIGFDFLFNEDGVPVLTDLNPRVTATIVLYKYGGLNLPYLRVKQLLREELPDVAVKYGVKLRRKYLDLIELC